MPIPASSASWGEAKRTGLPSMSTVPSYPPVCAMTGIPNRMFISVDFPAPFSPTSPRISPALSEKLTLESTRFP